MLAWSLLSELQGIRSAGLRGFGDEARRRGIMETLVRDIRIAARVLAKTPAFTALSIATIAFGIGASTAVFSMVNAVLLQPLPFTTSGTLIRILQPSAREV